MPNAPQTWDIWDQSQYVSGWEYNNLHYPLPTNIYSIGTLVVGVFGVYQMKGCGGRTPMLAVYEKDAPDP